MPRLNIILLDRQGDDYNFVLWADVPAARQSFYAVANAKSAWSGATGADNTAIANGSVAELVTTKRLPPNPTLPQIENFLQAAWTDYQNYITNYNPWNRYGSTWDGTTWTVLNNG